MPKRSDRIGTSKMHWVQQQHRSLLTHSISSVVNPSALITSIPNVSMCCTNWFHLHHVRSLRSQWTLFIISLQFRFGPAIESNRNDPSSVNQIFFWIKIIINSIVEDTKIVSFYVCGRFLRSIRHHWNSGGSKFEIYCRRSSERYQQMRWPIFGSRLPQKSTTERTEEFWIQMQSFSRELFVSFRFD